MLLGCVRQRVAGELPERGTADNPRGRRRLQGVCLATEQKCGSSVSGSKPIGPRASTAACETHESRSAPVPPHRLTDRARALLLRPHQPSPTPSPPPTSVAPGGPCATPTPPTTTDRTRSRRRRRRKQPIPRALDRGRACIKTMGPLQRARLSSRRSPDAPFRSGPRYQWPGSGLGDVVTADPVAGVAHDPDAGCDLLQRVVDEVPERFGYHPAVLFEPE